MGRRGALSIETLLMTPRTLSTVCQLPTFGTPELKIEEQILQNIVSIHTMKNTAVFFPISRRCKAS